MTTNEIVSAMGSRTPLAFYASVGTLRREELGKRSNVEKVEVLEHNPTRTDPAWNYTQRQNARKCSIRIRKLTALHASQVGVEGWVEPRYLLATWEEYETARAQHLAWVERGSQSAKERDQRREMHRTELETALSALGFNPDVSEVADPINGVRVTVTPDHFREERATARVTLTLAQVKLLIERASA